MSVFMAWEAQGEAAGVDAVAFTSQQVLRLLPISRRQLDYWIQQELITPEIDRAKGRGRVRLFSFRNLLELRVSAWLRDKVSLQLIRKIVRRLREFGFERPLTEITFGVVQSPKEPYDFDVVLRLPDGSWQDSRKPGQLIMAITVPVQEFAESLGQAVAEDRRKRRRVGHIERRRGALGSAPVLAGTRVPTSAIWRLHQAGYDPQRILSNYPGLEMPDIEAAIREEERRRERSRHPA